jgi:hypothetical protein
MARSSAQPVPALTRCLGVRAGNYHCGAAAAGLRRARSGDDREERGTDRPEVGRLVSGLTRQEFNLSEGPVRLIRAAATGADAAECSSSGIGNLGLFARPRESRLRPRLITQKSDAAPSGPILTVVHGERTLRKAEGLAVVDAGGSSLESMWMARDPTMRVPSDSNPEMASGSSSGTGPARPRLDGFVLGSCIAALFMFVLLTSMVYVYGTTGEGGSPTSATRVWDSLPYAVVVCGYLIALIVTARRSTRRMGQGMLMGLTIMCPIAFAIAVAILLSMI